MRCLPSLTVDSVRGPRGLTMVHVVEEDKDWMGVECRVLPLLGRHSPDRPKTCHVLFQHRTRRCEVYIGYLI